MVLRGGRWPARVGIFLSLIFIAEFHHVISAISAGAYYSGAVTGLVFAGIGVALLRECARALKAP